MNTFPVRCGFRRTMTSTAIHRLFLLIVTVTAFTVSALAQDIQKLAPALERLVDPDSKLERIATGFNKWTEGPVWTREGTLLFAEIPANNIDLWIPGKGARFHSPQRIYRCRAIQRAGARVKWNDLGS
jgi:hypothetical protein